jgi:glutathione S-transferase
VWILRSAAASPFARKVRIGAALCGLTDRIATHAANTNDPEDPVRAENPLGKIPVLILEDGTALFDSRVILEFLDDAAGGGVIIPAGPARFPALTLQALGDGMMDAAVVTIYETRFREPEMHSAKWLEHQSGKITRALSMLESAPPSLSGRIGVGEIAVACALGYFDLRFAGAWRSSYPRLVAWLDSFASKVPAYEATKPA